MNTEELSAGGQASVRVPVPKYFLVKESLLSRINDGTWAPGTAIPPEPEIGAEFGVSRITVRRAIGDLVHEEKLYTVQGKGTFVASPKVEERFIQQPFGIYEDFRRRGLTLATVVLRQEVGRAPEAIRGHLSLNADDQVHIIVRLRSVLGEKVLVSTTYIPYALCPELEQDDLTVGSLYALLESRYGLRIGGGERFVEATAADTPEAVLLDVPVGSPLLLLESFAHLPDGTPLEFSTTLHRGDRARVRISFLPTPEDI
jgi:GntR family transcriptional regulator